MAKKTKRRVVMLILDSNTIIYLSKELIKVDDIFNSNEEYSVSIITYMEVLGYRFDSDEEKVFIEKLFSYLTIIYIDETIANQVIELRQKNKIKLPDAIICATVLLNNAILITNDIRLKNIDNLKLKIVSSYK
jgi:predicted nucleic acid-binding protein